MRSSLILALTAMPLVAQTTVDVGSGAPSPAIQQAFLQAYYRNGFPALVSFPPIANVRSLGSAGLVQEFQDAAKTSGVKLALVMANQNAPIVEGKNAVVQVQAALYSYFTSLGASTAGMPVMDTANCPSLAAANSCQYQLFDKPYALFVYSTPLASGSSNVGTRDPFYTKWSAVGGINGIGPAISAETTITAKSGVTATAQLFDRGAIYNVTSGSLSGKIFSVANPIYTVYAANGADQGLGLPVSDELAIANGMMRQSFEAGTIDYDPKNPAAGATLRTPVAAVTVAGSANPIRLNLGDTVALEAKLADASGAVLTGRTVVWLTSDAHIVALEPSGSIVTVKAVGGGSASVTATSEGKASAAVKFVVTAPCCKVGEGAPSSSIAQAIQDAVNRNRLAIVLPAGSAVIRVGAGYLQMFQDSLTGANYMIGVSDAAKVGYLVAGSILARYSALGGPAGSLGYPSADPTPGGRQNFQNGTLAGTPVQLVSGAILARWAALGYETGTAGNPLDALASAVTFRATAADYQPFANAQLVSSSGKVVAVTGLIAARYAALGGPAGRLGAPLADEYAASPGRRQDFEGGSVTYAPGDTSATVAEKARQPVAVASPAAVVAGGRVRLGAGGFDDGSTVRVSVSGQPDFTVKVQNGAYVWDYLVPSDAKSASVTVRAADAANSAKAAQVSFTITALSDTKLALSAASGDGQTGLPGARLLLPLTVLIKDQTGNPVPAVPVVFTASPGGRIESAAAVTGADGTASAFVRLPAEEGIALYTASANRQVITLSARAIATAASEFQNLAQGADGAMLAAAAAALRSLQTRGEVPAPNGVADAALLGQYLRNVCGTSLEGELICDGFVTAGSSASPFVNLWRIPGFAGGAVDIVPAGAAKNAILDWVAQGVPVVVALELRVNGAVRGPHFVTAYGAAANGDLLIADPNPDYGGTALAQYLAGFRGAEGQISAVVTGSAAFVPRASRASFLVAANAQLLISGPSGGCGEPFETASPGGGAHVQFVACDGADAVYQIGAAGLDYRGWFASLGTPVAHYELAGGGAATFRATRGAAHWAIEPLVTAVTTGGIVNAASFTPDLAPGSLVTVFGSGLTGASVAMNGVAASVLSAGPFQVNAVVPAELPPGQVTVAVTSKTGAASGKIELTAVAPALFMLAGGQGAIVNRDGNVNSLAHPASRGDVVLLYGTGFGATVQEGAVRRTAVPVTASVGGVAATVLFAGQAPGFPGLYQLNVQLPAAMAPGSRIPVSVQQADRPSNTVWIAVQ